MAASRQILPCVFTVRGTKKFLDRDPDSVVPAADLQPSTTIIGAWYVTVLYWKPHIALFGNEPTRLPLLMPLAPAATVLARMPHSAAVVFASLGLDHQWIAREVTQMGTHQLTATANGSVLGTMNDFAYLADAHRTEPARLHVRPEAHSHHQQGGRRRQQEP